MTDDRNRIEVDTTDARAGATPGMTRYILGISLVLIVVVFLILFWR